MHYDCDSLSLSFSLVTESTPCSYRSPRDLLQRIYEFCSEMLDFNYFFEHADYRDGFSTKISCRNLIILMNNEDLLLHNNI